MKKFTDKILHHHHDSEDSEDREHEVDRSSERHQYKDTHVSFNEPHVSSTTTTTTGDLHKQHSFSEKAHEVVDKVLPHHTHTSRTDVHKTDIHHDIHTHEHIHEHINPPIIDTIVRPVIVEETVRRDKVIEIQPIIHRVVEAPEVHHIEKHLYEKVLPSGPARIIKQAVVEETIQPRITEDITTVLHREVPAPFIVHEEQHTTEHMVKPTTHVKEVIEETQTTIIAPTQEVLTEVRHTSDWDNQTVDTCPLAVHDKLVGSEHSTTTTTTTTTTPVHSTTTVFEDTKPLEHSFGKVSLHKEINSQGVTARPTQSL